MRIVLASVREDRLHCTWRRATIFAKSLGGEFHSSSVRPELSNAHAEVRKKVCCGQREARGKLLRLMLGAAFMSCLTKIVCRWPCRIVKLSLG